MRGAIGPLTSAVAAAGSVQRAHSARPAMRQSGSEGDRTYLMREAISTAISMQSAWRIDGGLIESLYQTDEGGNQTNEGGNRTYS
jgi:hypothetical protein